MTILKAVLIGAILIYVFYLLTGFLPSQLSFFTLEEESALLTAATPIVQLGINFSAPYIDWAFIFAVLLEYVKWVIGITVIWSIIRYVVNWLSQT